jgi:hypothetical protein
MRVSKYIKPDKNILIEYVYDDGNNIGDPYEILVNIKDNTYSYMAGPSSVTGNISTNQLFKIDGVTNNYGLVNTTNYSFLQIKDYASGFPVRHDTLKIHLPINYSFGEYLGCYVRVYSFDYNNQYTFDLSNFYFDLTDVDQSNLLNYTNPPLFFQEKLWGKTISIDIPSLYAIANQRTSGVTKPDSINYNLTNGVGMSLTAPIFIDFSFITAKKTINKVTTYYLSSKKQLSLPQTPDFENIGVKIQHSPNGDYFEIFGTYNDNIAEFNLFINNAVSLGNRYYVQYMITLYEQNIRGKSLTVTLTDNFNEYVEYRPIIKYSSTTAVIDVEMNLIDAVDNSSILRTASYGMLQDEVAKYSLNLTKINIANAHKPKIYNLKTPIGGMTGFDQIKPQVQLQAVTVNHTVLVPQYNVVAKSDNVSIGKNIFFGMGNLKLTLQPFDNIIKIIIAQDTVSSVGTSPTATDLKTPVYMDLSNMGEINFVIKNTQLNVSSPLYLSGTDQVDLTNGVTVFKIPASKINDVRTIFNTGINVFYITATLNYSTTVVYSGLFTMYDSTSNIIKLNNDNATLVSNINNNPTPSIITPPQQQATAIVTKKIVASGAQVASTKFASQVSGLTSSVISRF